MRTRLILAAALALSSFAAQQTKPVTETRTQTAGSARITVYVTQHGKKTYHTYRDCASLGRSKTVLTASEADAQQHGLVLCGICAHRHHAGVVAGDNSNWAKAEAKK